MQYQVFTKTPPAGQPILIHAGADEARARYVLDVARIANKATGRNRDVWLQIGQAPLT